MMECAGAGGLSGPITTVFFFFGGDYCYFEKIPDTLRDDSEECSG